MTKRLVLILIMLLSIPLALLISLRLLWATFTAIDRAWLIVIAYDDLWNVVSNGGLGQTISYRAATANREGKRWGCVLCHWLDEVQQGHCDKALTDNKQNLLPHPDPLPAFRPPSPASGRGAGGEDMKSEKP